MVFENPNYKFFLPQNMPKKAIFFSVKTHEAVVYYAKKKGWTIQQAAQFLMVYALQRQFQLHPNLLDSKDGKLPEKSEKDNE